VIAIVDPDALVQCPDGEVGEIWVSGPSVAQGYWNQAQETEHTFQASLADTGEGPFLRTGDLGFLKDGELYITGRLKDLIIIDGRNLYPQDIEWTVEKSHPGLQPNGCAAFSIEVGGEERLVVTAEVSRHYQKVNQYPVQDAEEMARAIRRAVAESHNVRVHSVSLLKAGTIPKTSSGKIQRYACRNGLIMNTLEEWGK
jgi:acyl-CoA synthetase (AMP-forming)/AMP-acid ligase II